ncbi:MAG: ribonuclease H-like domain-containing protein [Anaerolineae bacterium]|nr:ribonuclease H-like domain-containing protein [Anaerolineae bacterium]
MDESLQDKLKALGLQLGPSAITPLDRPQKTLPTRENNHYFPVEKVVSGEEMETGYGTAFILTEHYPVDLYKDHPLLAPLCLSDVFYDWVGHLPTEQDNYLFLDTETSGLSGGTGTFPFLIGLGVFDKDGFSLTQIFMRHPQEEQAVLAALSKLISGFNILVTYNGKSFDVPLINTRHKLHGFSTLFDRDSFTHIDMLPMARKIWKSRLPSRTLGDMERNILDIYRTEEEVPGWMIPDMYFDYLSTGDARPLSRVFYHNAIDIISLALLFNYTNKILLNPLSHNLDNIDLASIARIYESQNKLSHAIEFYQAAISQGLPVEIFIQTALRFAHIYKQQKDWDQAVSLWKKAAGEKSIDAAIELAKYYEHIVIDIPLAIDWAEKAGLYTTNQANKNGIWSVRLSNDENEKRLARLRRKIKDS